MSSKLLNKKSELRVFVRKQGMTDKEIADGAYWERNMLALYFAEGWYNDDLVEVLGPKSSIRTARLPGWRRILSVAGGKLTFHIPDSFNVGNLPEIEPNWDGHSTVDKWIRVYEFRGIR